MAGGDGRRGKSTQTSIGADSLRRRAPLVAECGGGASALSPETHLLSMSSQASVLEAQNGSTRLRCTPNPCFGNCLQSCASKGCCSRRLYC